LLFLSLFIYSFPSLAAAVASNRKEHDMAMSQDQLERWINELIKQDKLEKFYKCKEWRELSEQIKKENNYECVFCKRRGIHSPARSVHHVQWVRKHPRLALSRTYEYKGKVYQNLIPLCESCHNEQHPDKRVQNEYRKDHFMNEERW
jgi:5-methylcytosine-specific restriction endonuclease McrA